MLALNVLAGGNSPLGDGAYPWLMAVALIPLAAWLVQVFIGHKLPRQGDWLPTGAMGISAIIAIWMLIRVLGIWDPEFLQASATDDSGFTWKFFFSDPALTEGIGGFKAGILYDNLTAVLLAMVALVSFLVHLFSTGYMQGDSRYNIFFANLPFFTFAMLAMLLSDNLLFFFVFWEIMGLCSYLLIGHLAQDKKEPKMTAAWACLKAFMTTRVGDVCLFIGMMMVFKQFGTLNFHELYTAVADYTANGEAFPGWLTAGAIMMFLGAVGKSAQFPLHVWLPDAMEGPTPVSAMIHAATMVAAGVYLTGRLFLLMSPEAQLIVACIGAFTAIFAATIGITAFDIKKVLAYSTISQLGYMIAAIGVGGVAAGLFHVLTHALFKACLFLGSGSVIHGCHHEQDMRKMGGLRKKMPITYVTMLVSTLAISGVPLFAGFYSKDAILAKTLEKSMRTGDFLWSLPFYFLVVAAAITAFYMFRLIIMTFHGAPRDPHAEHAHESPKSMTIPLIILGIGALWGGKVWLLDPLHPLSDPWFLELVHDPELAAWNSEAISEHGLGGNGALHFGAAHGAEAGHGAAGAHGAEAEHGAAADHGGGHGDDIAHSAHTTAMIVSIIVASAGIALAFAFYQFKIFSAAAIAAALGGLYRLVFNKYYFDELYQATVIRGTMVFSNTLKWIDANIVDGVVNTVGRVMWRLGGFARATDSTVVDGLVNWTGETTMAAGQAVRQMQTGRIQQYAYFTFAGALGLAAIFFLDVF